MGALWHELDGHGVGSEAVGGKAASLDRLVALGVDVPLAVALTVEAYTRFVAHAGLRSFLRGLPATIPPSEIEAEVARVMRAFRDAPMEQALADDIRAGFDALGARGTVAVRSSATAEDMHAASFAGQYLTVLHVTRDGVLDAVRRCWASLWLPGARAYRAARGVGTDGLSMGVVLQRMVLAEHSGVVFSVDPTTGDASNMRIESVSGYGDPLVSGMVTPTVFRVDRATLTMPQDDDAPAFLPGLIGIARRIEEALEEPLDIEWSVENGAVRILQARPVTTVVEGDEFDTVARGGVTYTSTGLAEMLPGVLPPLLWTMNAPLVEHAFVRLFERLGIVADGAPGPMIARFRGRPALNLTRLKAAARRMPGGSGAEVEMQYLDRVVTDEPEARLSARERIGRVGPGVRSLSLRRRLLVDAETVVRAVDLAVDLQPRLEQLDDAALLEYRHRIRDLARFGVATEVAVAAAAAANYRGLERTLARSLGEERAAQVAQRVTAGHIGEQASGCGAVLSLWDVHCEYCQMPHVARAVYDGPLEGIEQRLRALGRDGEEFLRIVDDGLRRAGSAAIYGGRTWEEERGSFWSVLRRCRGLSIDAGPPAWLEESEAAGNEDLDALGIAIRATWRWRLTRVLTGQLVDVRWRVVRRMVSDASRFLRLREAVKSAVLRVGGAERRVIREVAGRLRARNLLEREGDEYLLSDQELEAHVLGQGGPDQAVVAARREAVDAMKRYPPLPLVFEGAPPMSAADEELEDGGVLRGWATSAGRVTGRARVVADLAEAHELQQGEILVGHATDPSWTPLFLTAAAIVMEEGGPLSHAAIVAREFKLPAVLNVRGATRRITTGMTITVDGARGTVELPDAETARRDEAGRVA